MPPQAKQRVVKQPLTSLTLRPPNTSEKPGESSQKEEPLAKFPPYRGSGPISGLEFPKISDHRLGQRKGLAQPRVNHFEPLKRSLVFQVAFPKGEGGNARGEALARARQVNHATVQVPSVASNDEVADIDSKLPPGQGTLLRAELLGRALRVRNGKVESKANFEQRESEFAPGCWVHHFPLEVNMSADHKPDIVEHSNRGASMFFIRPDISFAGDEEVRKALKCECGGDLHHVKNSLNQESGGFKVIFELGRRPSTMAQAIYQCQTSDCSKMFGATDPHILRSMPRRIAGLFPVRQEYAQGGSNFLFGKSLSDSFDEDLITYDNGVPQYVILAHSLSICSSSHRLKV